jgi:glycosyltransferase involved in cell wall biosynthesis
MKSFSVIVTAHNNGTVLPRALQSVEEAISFALKEGNGLSHLCGEVVVVDDGSTDSTGAVLRKMAGGKTFYRIVSRPKASSPSCARNAGATVSRGELLFFLDGDDLFFPSHVLACCRAMAESDADFIKTGIHLRDAIHPDWRPRIVGSLVINMCVRRRCHFAVGGFPDYHLFTRQGDEFRPALDIFYKLEDMFYNLLIKSLFSGLEYHQETVEHVRYPGNGLDRQYDKYCRSFGTYQETLSPHAQFQLQLANIIIQERLEHLKAQLSERPPTELLR